MRISKYKKNGFTLIELMITVAIVGILSSIALPAYKNYTIKAQATEGLSLLEGVKPLVIEYFSEKGELPSYAEVDGQASQIPLPNLKGKYIEGLLVMSYEKNATLIIAQFGNEANELLRGHAIALEAQFLETADNLIWQCYASFEIRYAPKGCLNWSDN